MKKHICFMFVCLVLLMLTNNQITSQGHLITPDGEIQKQSEQFIDCKFQKRKTDGLLVFEGTCRWIENGKPAIVPVRLYRKDYQNKKIRPLAVYYTEGDGKFYLATKDDDNDYALGPVASQAFNMPPRVKKFFDELKKKPEKDIKG